MLQKCHGKIVQGGRKVVQISESDTQSDDCSVCRSEVVQCLSSIVHNDTLLDSKHHVSESCRKQLRVELIQRVSHSFS